MKAALLAAAALACLAAAANAQPATAPSATCKSLGGVVDLQVKDLSYKHFSSSARSAPQATQLATEQQNTISIIALNLSLMAAHHCAMPTVPVSEMTYALNALECSNAEVQEVLGKPDPEKAAKCDRSKWTPLGSRTVDPKPAP